MKDKPVLEKKNLDKGLKRSVGKPACCVSKGGGSSNTASLPDQGNFTDSENIHSIIGSDKANHIEVSYADYVDGKGGNDVITVKNFTTIKGYFGDSIHGKGLVLLPINFNDIDNITHVNNITTIYNKSGAFISVDKQTSVKTADGLFVTPTKIDGKTGIATNLHVTKSISGDVVLDDKLDNLRKIDNSNFNITKQLSSANYHSTIGSSSNHIFYPDKEHHNFYWEAPSNISHLYLFDNRNANITIAQANGILDFSQLNCTLDDMPFTENNAGEIKINKNGLNVTLLSDYKDVTVTFDGEEYYKLQSGELERDYCSHSLKIDGRFSVNGTDLLNHHNCFTFDSDKVLFLKLNNDLLLLSDRGALSISHYYSSVHKNWDLSVELNNRIMEPEEFGERAEDFSSFRYYKPDEQGLQIYHNQPINKNDIGLVDLKGKSILDFDMKVMNDTLLLSHKNNTLVKVENWNTYQPAREMIFAFNDATVSNSKCIVSTCKSEDIVVEFNREKEQTQLDKELSDAVQSNSFSKVKSLVSRGANINAKDNDGNTLLHNAAREDRLDAVKCLIDNGANINVKNNRNLTPLQVVGSNSNIERVLRQAHLDKELLLTVKSEEVLKTINNLIVKGINGGEDRHGAYYFAWAGDLGTVKFIVQNEGSVNVTDKYGCTLLHWAALKGHSDIAKFLVDKGANVNAKDILGRTPMHFAASNGKLDIVKYFIDEEKVDVNIKDNGYWTPLHWASWGGHLDVAKYLVDKRANINAKDKGSKIPLNVAIDQKHNDVVKYLEQAQLDLNKELLIAAKGGDLNKVIDLISKGANVNVKDNNDDTPLHLAVGYLDVVKYLISKGANINAKCKAGATPLDIAAYQKLSDVVEYLKQTQLDLDKKLLIAVKSGGLNKIIDLFNRGANINAENEYGKNPIHIAAESDYKNIIEFLLSKEGVGVNDTDEQGHTPLHWASWSGHLGMLEYLIGKGANINAKCKAGRTTLDIARDKGYNNIVEYLEGKLKEEREKPAQRKRRHHHGDHDHHRSHLSRNLLAIDSSGQPEIAASSGTRPSSWINGLLGWVKSSVGGLFYSRAALPEETLSTTSSISQVDAPIDVNGTIMLLDLLIRKVTGQKYIFTVDQSISPLEAQGYALNIKKGFRKVVEQAARDSKISIHRLDIDFIKVQEEITRKVMDGKFNEISGILNSHLEKACPGREAGCPGKLSPKKFEKFIAQFNKGLLNQSIEQILHNRDSTLEVDGTKQMNLEPQSYLSNASIQSHSKDKVSTCLSEIGVTKLGGNLNR
ncbi:ankyrin repeat domain-containing protein [Wolbachia pipientis]|uniref:ankyrin repeat domain-containing protein n=2 Tax=Wolbachia pipientis TaxID=955 RepID=UPI002572EEF4|nr:ankyrin repeat domain-containing protein [Wolbachia pipientis]BDG76743.1 hypothetical protein wHmt_13010 [Wolbachia pipientis]BDH38456.1 Octomom homologue [Wolbachia endosymbiont of Homona magnanima]